jgi:hypothetical protein
MRNSYRILVLKPERKRQLGRLRLRWKVNIKIDIGRIWCEGVDCIIYLRFQVLTAEGMTMIHFWAIPSCSQVEIDRRFSGAY